MRSNRLLMKLHINNRETIIEAKDKVRSATPLNWAAGNGHVEVVKLLLNARANIEAANKYGQTPLHRAAWDGHVEVVKLLLNARANIEAADKGGRSALSIAQEKGHEEVVMIL